MVAYEARIILGSDRGPGGPPIAPPGPDTGETADPRKGRILVVEDEAILAFELTEVLEELGFEVTELATTAPDAVAAAERTRPDLVMMDIRLARRTDGVEAAREIRDRLGIRSIYLTAHTDPATLARAQATDPLGFIAKPYTPNQIAATLRLAFSRLRAKH